VLAFDQATDSFLDAMEMGARYRQEEKKSFFVVESHVCYEQEVTLDTLLVIQTKLVGFDKKRLHLFHEMFDEKSGIRSATNEILALHVDMKIRKSTGISNSFHPLCKKMVSQSLEDGFPQGCGRTIKRLVTH
ncbi:MAG: thioesterase family protein, partial [Methylocystaceae bacterium]|nr:thioesterase family protein [Methylocystaceae bacterium]